MMPDQDNEDDIIAAQLRQEFVESARDQIDGIDVKLDMFVDGGGGAKKELLSIQRHIHNIKGQGATFGFPLTGRVAHMLEDYLINADGIPAESIADIRVYLSLMIDLIATDENIAKDDPQGLLRALPTGQVVTFSTQRTHDINVLLVMPSGLQRRLVSKELLSCGFRVMRAYDSVEALSIALDITPDIVFVNYDMTPFNGGELSNVFAAIDKLRDIHFVLLTSYQAGDDRLQNLHKNVSVVQKNTDFMENIGELLIQWGVFGNIPDQPSERGKSISQNPKTARVVKFRTQRPLSILVAEDNQINQHLIKATLEAFGHRLEIADNGLLAVEALKGGDFELILMDVLMPEMSGPDATRVIRKIAGSKGKTPIIAVTADVSAEHKKKYFAAGMDECVGKPIDRAELFAAINKVMGEEIHLRIEEETAKDKQAEAAKPAGANRQDEPEEADAGIAEFLQQLQDVAAKYDRKK